MPEFYVLSQRDTSSEPAQGCVVEFENVLVRCCEAALLPCRVSSRGSRLHSFLRATGCDIASLRSSPFAVDVPPPKTSDEQILVAVGLDFLAIYEGIRCIPGWRSRFDRVCAYVFDAYIPWLRNPRPQWRERISLFAGFMATLDHLFIPATGNLDHFRERYGIPVSFLPMACDVLTYGKGAADRSIDVIGYGRQPTEQSRLLAQTYNEPGSSRIYYHTDHSHSWCVRDHLQQRRLFWRILGRSRISLTYDAFVLDKGTRSPFPFVGQRWFESLAAGCMVVGRQPACPEAADLLCWEDCVIDSPEDPADLVPLLEELLSDEDRLRTVHQRNYAESLARHDWRHRLGDMLDILGVPHPGALASALQRL